MKKTVISFLLLILILNGLVTNRASAYSYGDPNEEKVAEVYKEIVIKLDENPPNFSTAKELYGTIKEEIDMHMGKDPSTVILKDIDAKDKEKTIKNLEELMVLNIARRLESIEKNFKEYDTSKRLLAKAFATYEALSPKVEAKNPETDKAIRKDFDEALNSLGNPGLFGVGKKEADLEAFKASKDKILSDLKKEFNIKTLEVGHFSESATETNSGKKDWTDVSNFKNWIPIILIVGLIAGVVYYSIRKRK
jgi:hypothetical protein